MGQCAKGRFGTREQGLLFSKRDKQPSYGGHLWNVPGMTLRSLLCVHVMMVRRVRERLLMRCEAGTGPTAFGLAVILLHVSFFLELFNFNLCF